MAPNIDQPEMRANAVEGHLSKRADEGASCAELAAILQDYRTACEAFTSTNFGCDATHDTEQKLWAAHLKVNTIFRQEHKILRRNRENVVEIRKFHKVYLHFIKASQRFYRQHILDLDAQFDGIPELRKIAHKWKDDTSKQASRQRIPSAQRNQILLSCHQTLIHLGDLSRYRETELVDKDDKERNWGPAKGYYGLAAEIYPDSGHAHNQLAVISREDGDHFRSVYHLYRSLATKMPYPQAKANLELEFKRVISAWEKGQLINNHKSSDGNNSGRALIAWFIRLHSRIYKGEEFAAHDELEGEVLSHLAIELKERPLDSILTKIILITFAAEYFATVQMQSQAPPPNIMRTYFFYLRLNVKTFFILLQVLQPELERLSEGDDVKNQNGDRAPQLSDKITAVARRILPGLRLYSTWFTRYWKVLNANIADTLTTVDVQELWKAYAATLTLLASSFPVEKLPAESYMLEEDTETIAFQPLLSPDTMKVWYDGETQKQKWTDLERNHPNVEMLMRIKDLLIDGLLLTQNPEAPLDLDVTRFIYREEGLPSELLASPNTRPDHSPIRSPQMEVTDIPLFPAEKVLAEDQKSHSVTAASESASTTMAKDNAMLRMVDDLVGPDDGLDPLVEEDEDTPPTPPSQIFEDTTLSPGPFSITDLVSNVKNYKSVSPGPGHRMMATPMGRSGSTSSMRLPANLPSLPDGSSNSAGNSIWNLQYNGTPGPSSPMRPNSHARGDSNTSLLGVEGFSTPHSGFNSDPTWGTNSATWGNGYNNHNSGVNQYNTTLASPLMFQSSLQHNAHSSWRHTPPNGQGG